jgi:hypothetical protein
VLDGGSEPKKTPEFARSTRRADGGAVRAHSSAPREGGGRGGSWRGSSGGLSSRRSRRRERPRVPACLGDGNWGDCDCDSGSYSAARVAVPGPGAGMGLSVFFAGKKISLTAHLFGRSLQLTAHFPAASGAWGRGCGVVPVGGTCGVPWWSLSVDAIAPIGFKSQPLGAARLKPRISAVPRT